MPIVRFTAFLLTFVLALPANAVDNTHNIEWDNLVPKMAPLDNPFTALTMDQRTDFEILVGIRDMKRRGFLSEVDEAFEDETEIRKRLNRQGLSVDDYIVEYSRLEQEIIKRNKMTNAELDGQIVRIPGYALPLEHKDTGVKELLLVPYVGACIHVPPPPANQIVYVTLKDAYTSTNLYEPVWITGRMTIKTTNQSLTYVDGTAGIDAAYTLKGEKVEPYEK